MPILVWLPWVVAAALLLSAVFAIFERRREGRPVSFEFLGRTWSAGLVALVVAAVLTWDHFVVDDQELRDAVDRAAAEIDGSTSMTLERAQYAAEDSLGRELFVEDVDIPEGANDSPVDGYEFRASEGSDTVVCLEISSYNVGVGTVTYGAQVRDGECGE